MRQRLDPTPSPDRIAFVAFMRTQWSPLSQRPNRLPAGTTGIPSLRESQRKVSNLIYHSHFTTHMPTQPKDTPSLSTRTFHHNELTTKNGTPPLPKRNHAHLALRPIAPRTGPIASQNKNRHFGAHARPGTWRATGADVGARKHISLSTRTMGFRSFKEGRDGVSRG